MPGYTLTYFPLRGRAEPTRLLLADQGVSWTEEEVQLQDWHAGKVELKKTAVFGQIPRLQDGDFVLYQSNSILRYLGHKYGLSGSSDQEHALIDMVNDGVEDLRQKFYKFIFQDKGADKEKFLHDLTNHLAAFERILCKNSNGTKFLVGDKISFADYNLLDVLQCYLDLSPAVLTSFPLLTSYIDRILSRPSLSEYLKSNGRKKRPIIP
ncbi:glutathione S-transferase P 1 [Bombina bombina]|uniref:glutathione S-transferase P 1 n=1 Tax=Bombina bombina TaxID=8345 RepID=UPI00235AA311|nr:glutathione S-transferase P 1 [Bombina bombina]